MPDTVEPGITFDDLSKMDQEALKRIRWDEFQGDRLQQRNGFSYKRSLAISRSTFANTPQQVSR